MRAEQFALDMLTELREAKAKYPAAFHSGHEGYAVLLEEVQELWDLVKMSKRTGAYGPEFAREATQIAAMAARFAIELCKDLNP